VGLPSSSPGVTITPAYGLEEVAGADLVALPAFPAAAIDNIDPGIIEAIRAADAAGATILTVCSGAFLAGAAGLLDGRKCTTHWRHVDELARRFPEATVDPDVLFVDAGNLITSAGTAAGIDACLHLVRREIGSAAANSIARRMVVPPQRDGGQSQYIESPVPECKSDSFALVTEWMLENLEKDLTVDVLARRALMSSRTFARKFRAETGTTPAAWLNRQRILRSQQLLEETDEGLEQIAQLAGFGTASVMRHHFLKVLQTTPTNYRRTFGARAAG
jgi:transcriptional regulator GlxA family with amidase domain